MYSIFLVALSWACLLRVGVAEMNTTYPTVFTEWVALNYTWDENHTYLEYVSNGSFIVENCLLAGINVDFNGDIYLTVPRWRQGVPATLNKLNVEKNTLTPYPSWEMQEVGVDGDLQNCQSMTIDQKHRMWVIEVGWRNFFDLDPSSFVDGAAGIWLIDMDTGNITTKYYFPEDVLSYNSSFLNDIALDEDREIAYFSDAWGQGGIVVFDLNSLSSYRYTGPSTENDPTYQMIINGVNYGSAIFTTPSDGIALTEDNEALFYCSVQNTVMYRLPTSVLRNFSSTDEEITAAVEVLGTKDPSDGIKYLNGTLYWGSLTNSTYYHANITATSFPNINVSVANTAEAGEGELYTPEPASAELMMWIDTFTIDLGQQQLVQEGRANEYRMYFTSNRLNLYSTYTMDFSGASGANMRILYVDSTFNVDSADSSEGGGGDDGGGGKGGKNSKKDDDSDDDEVDEFSEAEVAGAVVGTIAAVSIIGGIAIYCYLKAKSARNASSGLVANQY